MRRHRREFLSWLGASTLLAAMGRSASAQAPAGESASGVNDVARSPVSDKWDMSWVERISGDARAVFDLPEAGEGEGVWRAERWREDYHEVYGETPDGPTAVLVIRHAAIPLIMDNDYWKRFEVGKKLGIKNPDTKKWAVANPVSTAHDGAPTKSERYTIQHFLANGGIVLACNLAFVGRVVSEYGKADDPGSEDAYARAREHMLPGVILQPSGVFATLRAQQAGCAYILAS
ncbi:MAG TPA: hypothetical protein VFK04_20815 [Gemmatimonadaceae bacterium]|jgi:hypothetical protein|nr:hypothetical protein [Gemmatimonadaceae bacterium]